MIYDFVAFRTMAYVSIDARTRPTQLRWPAALPAWALQRGHHPDLGGGANRISSGCHPRQATTQWECGRTVGILFRRVPYPSKWIGACGAGYPVPKQSCESNQRMWCRGFKDIDAT